MRRWLAGFAPKPWVGPPGADPFLVAGRFQADATWPVETVDITPTLAAIDTLLATMNT